MSPTRTRDAARDQPAAPERAKFGQKLLSPSERTRLEYNTDSGNPFVSAHARFWLGVDDSRRRAAGVREAESRDDGPKVQLTKTGVVGAGGGRWRSIAIPAEYRGTTAQVAGLWPWSVGAGAPLIGTPLGRHLRTGAPVCFDPLNWFKRGGFLTAPSLFILGLNGFGKSSLVRRIVLGGVAQGIKPLILADVKPDYRSTIERVGGQIIDLGYGHGKLNPLDNGTMAQALLRLEAEGLDLAAETLRIELRARTTNLVAGLIELARGERIKDYENTLLSTAHRVLFRPVSEGGRGFTVDAPPILDDLAAVIDAGGVELQLDAGAKTVEQYEDAIIGLRRSLRALTQGNLGEVFNGQTTTPLDMSAVGVCVDVSHIAKNDKTLKAAAMLASWSQGFGAIEALNLLAELGLEKQQYYQVVMDELWQVLGLGEFMIERVDELTRLQRGIAVSLIMVSHTIKDLLNLGSAGNRAVGFFERCRAKILGALPADELAALDGFVQCTEAEAADILSWSAPQALTGEPPRRGAPPPLPAGVGKWLLKVAEDRSPGIPFALELTDVERESGIHDTSSRFENFGRRDEPAARGGNGERRAS
ncbi:hypothetical protein ACWELJ_32650 [Nocardia sp. NPDC004582]